MQLVNAKYCVEASRLSVLMIMLVAISCGSASGEYEIVTFDLGQGRSIEILASETLEVTQSFYYRVKVDHKTVVPLYMMCAGHDKGQLKFKTIVAKGGDVVGVFEQKYPNEILAIHDFRSNASWPNTSVDKKARERDQAGEELLKELQAEHQDIKMKLGQYNACD